MEIELAEIRDFIARFPPFDVLGAKVLNTLPKKLTIQYFRQGSKFPAEQTKEKKLYIIRSGAIELRDKSNQLVDKLAEGESYFFDELNGICIEDTLVYSLHYEDVKALQENNIDFARQFNVSVNERLRKAIETTQSSGMRDLSAMKLEVSGLTKRFPVIVDISSSIQSAAKLMTEEKVSSILVTEAEQLVGLVTDRDIKSRCVAAGLDYNEAISQIMTRTLETVQPTTLLSEALILMTRNRVHHLPIMRAGKPVGMLTTSDVIRHLSTSPAFIASDIYQANSLESLIKISKRLPELQLQLSLSSATAQHIGDVFSSITDAITARLIELAEQVEGSAPVAFVWMAAGSQARNEQTSHTDQDNAMIISDQCKPEQEAYFEKLAKFVCDGLDACGYEYCPGNAMALNAQWRSPLASWKKQFSNWINYPEPEALMLSSIFFDMRPVHGDSTLFTELQNAILKQTTKNESFLSHMVSNALTRQPPIGFFRNFVMANDEKHKNTLDIKHQGIVLIVDIARILALEHGLKAVNTTARLQEAFASQGLSHEMHANLIDALEYIASLRIRHQAKRIQSGYDADNFLPPDELSGIEKSHLKDAFAIIKTMQSYFESKYPSSRIS